MQQIGQFEYSKSLTTRFLSIMHDFLADLSENRPLDDRNDFPDKDAKIDAENLTVSFSIGQYKFIMYAIFYLDHAHYTVRIATYEIVNSQWRLAEMPNDKVVNNIIHIKQADIYMGVTERVWKFATEASQAVSSHGYLNRIHNYITSLENKKPYNISYS